MNQDTAGRNIAGTDRPAAVSRAAPRRRDDADADTGNEVRSASGHGAPGAGALLDPLRLNDAVRCLWSRLAADPAPLVDTWLELAQSWTALWSYGAARIAGADADPVARADGNDRRFRDDAWDDVPWFDLVKQAYLVNARACTALPARVAGLDESVRNRLEFAARQVTDALAPTNFFATNPVAIRTAFESNGTSAIDGVKHYLRDFDPETGGLNVRMCPPDAFHGGRDRRRDPGQGGLPERPHPARPVRAGH